MDKIRAPFKSLPWTAGGHPLERKKAIPGLPLALLEFAPGFEDPKICRNGHAGYVVCGELTLELDGGRETIPAGEGFVFPPGTNHRAMNLGKKAVRLFIVTTPERS